MNGVITCYSLSGTTRKVCEQLADMAEMRLEHIKEVKKRGIIMAFLSGARQAMTGRASDIEPVAGALSGADVVCLAGPIWASAPAPALNAVIYSGALKDKKVMCVLTCSGGAGDAAETLRKRLSDAGAQCAGVQVLRKSDIDEQRLERVAAWLKQMARGGGA